MKVTVNDIEIFYTKSGEGSPLILLHGNGEDHNIFLPLIKQMEKDYTVYALDSRNHGQSELTDDYSYDAMAKDVAEFIKKLGLSSVHLVGFSDGGIICLLLGIHYQLPITKMAVLGANLSPEDFSDESMAFVKELYEKDPSPLIKLMLDEPNITVEQLKKVQIPTFVIAAENDIYRPEVFERIHQAIPNAEAKIIEGHDHGSYIIENDLLAEDLLAFFRK